MNGVKILVVEESGGLDIALNEVLEESDYQEVIQTSDLLQVEKLLEEQLPDMAFVEHLFLKKNGREDLLEKLESLEIPAVCLFPNENFGNKKLKSRDEPYAILGERFTNKALKNCIENTLFNKNKKEYVALKKQLLVEDHIFVKMGSQLEKINTSQILYVASDGNYSMVQTQERKYAVKSSLKKMLEGLPDESFARIHRGYLVQLGKISKVSIAENQIYIGEQKFPLGRYYKSDILARLNKLG